MDSVTIENYRCFRERQTARLAPLTLLVGENSTGKTSFLALLRALWDVAVNDNLPNFRIPPYDLGGFNEVVYSDSSQNEQLDWFQAGFVDSVPAGEEPLVSFDARFKDSDGMIVPVSRRVSMDDAWIDVAASSKRDISVQFGVADRSWALLLDSRRSGLVRNELFPLDRAVVDVMNNLNNVQDYDKSDSIRDVAESYAVDVVDRSSAWQIRESLSEFIIWQISRSYPYGTFMLPFAGAPIRSMPKRTYDPGQPTPDPEGAYIPTYLARLSRREPDEWKDLKRSLEGFGQASGLFDEIHIESFGRTDDSTPFQVRVRKFGKRRKGLHRNLMDVGYGVSQALPLVTELLRPDTPSLFLLQQPEVHLHPSAQAALGSLFCAVAGPDRQIVVETHSDNIIDRVRMDVRDKKSQLTHRDVSVLYFERGDADVTIHSIEFDKNGNVLGAPPGYRQFFSDELTRSIGLL